MLKRWDERYRYGAIFDPLTGKGARSTVVDAYGNPTEEEAFRGSFPELLDIGIMGHCEHGESGLCLASGVQCYQKGGNLHEEHMRFEDFAKIIDEAQGKTFQVALGGRGDPDRHPEIIRFLAYAHHHGITPNFTTSGYHLDPSLIRAIKQYCGAVAVSWYRNSYTMDAISMLTKAGIKTNIHYVLSASTIDEAIQRTRERNWPSGINRIIFLLHKPVGYGSQDEVLHIEDPRVKTFFALFDQTDIAERAGFDSCCVPAILNLTTKIHPACIEACEAGRFSAYISPDLKLYPCSFEKDDTFAVSLSNHSIQEAWDSEIFESFRDRQIHKCPQCSQRSTCLSGCPVKPEITLCARPEKNLKELAL